MRVFALIAVIACTVLTQPPGTAGGDRVPSAPPNTGPAPSPPTYSRHVKPILTQYCQTCHTAAKRQGGLSMDSYADLMEGGVSGPVIVPGEPDESWLVRLTEGRNSPVMPPKSAEKRPTAEEIALLREWVKAGGGDDSDPSAQVPPKAPVKPPVSALAYSRDGKFLAAGTYGTVYLLDAANHRIIGKVHGQLGKVTALAYNRSGSYLAVASGEAGKVGQVRVYFVPPSGLPTGKPEYFLRAHADLIHDLAFSPDNETLATASYDRTVKLWEFPPDVNPKDPKIEPRAELKDHSDAVFGLAFSPDSKLLATAAADRTVKVWDVKSAKRLYTLGDAAEGLNAVAWHPEGSKLAAAGGDKSIRVWQVNADGGKLLHSVFAHEKAVIRLAFSADGHALYSLGEDQTAKAWDFAKLTEKRIYAKQPDAVPALAVHSGLKQVALGRFDGALTILNEESGKVLATPLPAQPKRPAIMRLSPAFGQRGKVLDLDIHGRDLDLLRHVELAGAPQVEWAYREGGVRSKTLAPIRLVVPENVEPGTHLFLIRGSDGDSSSVPFVVDRFAPVHERGEANSLRGAQPVELPASLIGTIAKSGETDFYRFSAKAGDEIGVQLGTASSGSKTPTLEPVLLLFDHDRKLVAESGTGLLGHRCLKDGTYTLAIRDRDYRGDPGFTYRLHVGPVPIITGVYPLGVGRHEKTEVQIEGVNLNRVKAVAIHPPETVPAGGKLPVRVSTPDGEALGGKSVVVGEFPEVLADQDHGLQTGELAVPATANGRLSRQDTHVWKFRAKKGERLIVEVHARRLGSPMDSFIEILDADAKPVLRAMLRCLAKTAVAFRDHDSAGAGIRLEAWNELAVNDFLYVGGELIRIWALPKNPDDDCLFFSVAGQRQAFLDTTPTHHAMNTPAYKVELHPPDAKLPPNGMPVFPLTYRNDDGGAGYGKDSRLFFDPPADGEYRVRIGNHQPPAVDGSPVPYRLTIRPPRPGFNVSFQPNAPQVWKGGAISIQVSAERIDGYDGPIAIRLDGLPPGLSAPATTIPAGETTTSFALFAEADAVLPDKPAPLKLIAKAQIDGNDVIKQAVGGTPQLVEPGDIATTTDPSEVRLHPGGQVRLTVQVKRLHQFAGRVPIEVRGLPHGVHVLDVGLNGILITETESARTIVLACEPWVKPTEQPFVVLARREGKNTDHAARSVLLRVTPKE